MITRKEKYNPLVLLILDGFGITKPNKGNAVTLAKTPNLDKLLKVFPNSKLRAHGQSVGLLPDQDGNSEAGHLNIGAGRIVDQDALYISKSISDGTFFDNNSINSAINHSASNKSNLHLIGLLSDEGSAHSNPDHLIALLTLARVKKIKVYLHFFTDGRDSSTHSAVSFLDKITYFFRGNEQIATISGRFYGMDRSRNWGRTKLAYEAITEGRGLFFESAKDAVLSGYNKDETDEYIAPSVIVDKKTKKPKAFIKEDDAVIFFNLRADRTRQLTQAFSQKKFSKFRRRKVFKNLKFVTLTDYGPDLPGVESAFFHRPLKGTLPFALKGRRQLYISETEKYPHITYYFNGGYARPVSGEDWLRMESPQVKYYDRVPHMSTAEINSHIMKSIVSKKYETVVANFACTDMIGHTGNLSAAIEAVNFTDKQLGKLQKIILSSNGTLIITADHGNIEKMIDLKSGEVSTKHTKNFVPFILVNEKLRKNKIYSSGVLADISPTVLDILDIPAPAEMTGKSLIKY